MRDPDEDVRRVLIPLLLGALLGALSMAGCMAGFTAYRHDTYECTLVCPGNARSIHYPASGVAQAITQEPACYCLTPELSNATE